VYYHLVYEENPMLRVLDTHVVSVVASLIIFTANVTQIDFSIPVVNV